MTVLWAALALLFGAGCEMGRPGAFAAGPAAATPFVDSQTNILQSGDTLEISFQYSSNYSSTQKISPVGSLNMQGVGEVKAAGKTPLQLQTDLLRLYQPLVKDDVITVTVLSAQAAVYVSGAVLRPGKIALERSMTALEAIMEAGGFDSSRAQLGDVSVLRLEFGRQRVYHINMKRVLRGLDDSPFYLRPFDIIHVPAKTFNF
jgi:polysaccharide export outer membrane protein